MFKNINLSQIVSIVVISLFIGVVFVYANWSDPPASPPTCPSTNSACNAPINASGIAQYKSGSLGIGGVFQVFSDAVLAKLDVQGDIRVSGRKISGRTAPGCPDDGYTIDGKIYGRARGFNDEGDGNDFYMCCRQKQVIYWGMGSRADTGSVCDEQGERRVVDAVQQTTGCVGTTAPTGCTIIESIGCQPEACSTYKIPPSMCYYIKYTCPPDLSGVLYE